MEFEGEKRFNYALNLEKHTNFLEFHIVSQINL